MLMRGIKFHRVGLNYIVRYSLDISLDKA